MFDAYTRKARLAPALIAALPAIGLLLAAAVVPSASSAPIAALLAALGIVLCGAVRDRGRSIEPALWESWGGAPTLRRLRWRETHDLAATMRLHQRLSVALDLQLPSQSEERHDPNGADRRYDDAIAGLRERTRDGFPLVLAESAEYGFRRNTLGLRPVALVVAAMTFGISAILVAVTGEARFVAAATVALAAGVAWSRITDAWVRRAAEVYADRLLDAARGLVSP